MDKYRLWEEKPAQEFSDAHYLGNGRIGFSVFGGVPKETVVINEDTLWSGHETFQPNENHYENMMRARKAVLENQPKLANDIMNEEMTGRWLEAYMPMATLHFMSGQQDNRRNMPLKRIIEAPFEEVTAYRRELELWNAVEKVSWERDGCRFVREYFVSAPAQAGFVYLTGQDLQDSGRKVLNSAVSLDSKLSYQGCCGENWIALTGIAPDHAEPSYTPVVPEVYYRNEAQSKALRFACAVRVLDTDGEVSSDGIHLYIRNASYAFLAVTAKTNYTGVGKPRNNDRQALLEQVLAQLRSLEATEHQARLQEHIRDYQSYYCRMDLQLGEELTGELPTSTRLEACSGGIDDPSLSALLLQYARYLTISGSRPGTQALNLQGIWNDSTTPAWSSNYTTNINVEMNYWPCEKLNLSDCHEPMMTLLQELAERGQQTAREYYHAPGWVAHHNVDLWKSTEPAGEDASWFWWPLGGAWMCQHIWVHYEYTKDTVFLRKMYPVLREAAAFFLHFLAEDENGCLVTAPSTSPENKYIWRGGTETLKRLILEVASGSRCSATDPDITAVTKGSTMDMSILRELFSNVTAAAEILGIDDDIIASLQAAKQKFPPYRTGRFGQLLEWDDEFEECTPGMGHISHMYPVYPGNLFTEEKTPELFEAARISLERRNLNNGAQDAWPGAWRIALMARFHNSLECGHILKSTGATLGAGLLLKNFQQMDVSFGLGAGIGEMLLQSHHGMIELIPAIPVDWEQGAFHGMRARGGFEAELTWKNGHPVSGSIRSELGGTCRLLCRGLKAAVLPDGSVVEAKPYGRGQLLCEWETHEGESYQLVFTENTGANRSYQLA